MTSLCLLTVSPCFSVWWKHVKPSLLLFLLPYQRYQWSCKASFAAPKILCQLNIIPTHYSHISRHIEQYAENSPSNHQKLCLAPKIPGFGKLPDVAQILQLQHGELDPFRANGVHQEPRCHRQQPAAFAGGPAAAGALQLLLDAGQGQVTTWAKWTRNAGGSGRKSWSARKMRNRRSENGD